MHTQYPDNPVKRFFTYRNRGYVLAQPGLRTCMPAGMAALRLVLPGDPPRPGRASREWLRLQRLGARERFDKP
jgi:rhamnopyranosyl-N-acetylglucosaminyl-diphospho-decaprenol beta-1,3/1,4-galactofuranosyltransferase